MPPSEAPAPIQQPGTTVTPGSAATPLTPQPQPVQPAQMPPAMPQPTPPQESPAPSSPEPSPAEADFQQPQFSQETDGEFPVSHAWTASEFIDHEKNAGWYLMLGVGAIAVAAILYWFTKDKVTPAVVVVAAILFGIYGSRKPRQIDYLVDQHGVQVGPKQYQYGDFRSFSVMPDRVFSSIVLMPLKRFAVPITLYYPPNDEEIIVNIIADQLPHEQRKSDAVDKLMRRIRY